LSAASPDRDDPNRDFSVRLLLFALEIVGDPGAAESLLAEAAGRAFRWSRPDDETGRHRAMLRALIAVSHGPLNRCPRGALPRELLPGDDEFDQDIEHALSELGGRERAALYMVLVEEYSYEECAAVLGTTSANAGMLVYRARAALRSRLVGAPVEETSTGSAPMPTTNQRISRVIRSDCRQAGAFISAEIDGELSEKQRTVLGNHMESCGVCEEERSRLEQASAAVLGHWRAILDQLLAGGWDRRAAKATSTPSSANIEAARMRQLRLGLFAACVLIAVAGTLLWIGLLRSPLEAVSAVEGKHSRSGDLYEATEKTRLAFFDGSSVELEPGAALRARRIQGLTRPKIHLLAGTARFQVSPGTLDLEVNSAAGQAKASSGAFTARIIARDSRGRRLKMRFTTAESLAPGERLALTVDSRSERLVLTGTTGPEMPLLPGTLASVPAGEQPRKFAVPGRWVALPRAGSDPAPRSGAALAYDSERELLVLFGGRGRRGKPKPLDEVWMIDPGLGGWKQLSCKPDPAAGNAGVPGGQQAGALLPMPSGKGLWLYAGTQGETDVPELWKLDVGGPAWTRLPPKPPPPRQKESGGKKTPALPGRRGAALATCRAMGGFVLVGGEAARRSRKDTWFYSPRLNSWKRVATGDRHPEARSGATLCAAGSGSRLYLFGGRSSSGRALKDTWCLDVAGKGGGSWTLLKSSSRPDGRWGATMASDDSGKRLLLFGGRPRWGGPRRDTWLLSTKPDGSATWNPIVSQNSPPGEEFGPPAMVWHPGSGSFLLWCRDRLWALRLRD